jgi:DNA-binding ferritin-like protein (Dps family)
MIVQTLTNLYPKRERTKYYARLETLCEDIYDFHESYEKILVRSGKS